MADASKMPNNLVYFQWGRPDNENPRLSSAISATATTIVVTNAATDEDGSAITGNFIMGIKDNNGYTENVWVPNAASTDGLTFTGCVRGIDLAGLDYTTQNTAGNAVAHEAGDPVKCIVSGVNFQLMLSALQGGIASGGENWQIGNATNNNITIYAANGDANKPFWRYVAASNQWVYSNDGVSSTPFGTGAGVTGGDGITVTAGDIDVDLATNSGLEFSSSELRVKIKTNGGVVRDSNGLSLDLSQSAVVGVDKLCPSGMLAPYAGATAPTGWLLCDGTTGLNSVTDTTLAALFAVIGTTFGGTGAADFDLPDMRGNFPLGKDNMGGSSRNRVTNAAADTVGSEAGAETHTLITAEMPAHTHEFNYASGATSGALPQRVNNSTPAGQFITLSTGGDGAHNNMSPYMTFNYIIKK